MKITPGTELTLDQIYEHAQQNSPTVHQWTNSHGQTMVTTTHNGTIFAVQDFVVYAGQTYTALRIATNGDVRQNEEMLWTIKKYRLMVMPSPTEGSGKVTWLVGKHSEGDAWLTDNDLTVDAHFTVCKGDTLYNAVMAWRKSQQLDDLADITVD